MPNDIEIRINGEQRSVPPGGTIEGLLRSLDLQPAMIVVEHNGEIVRPGHYPNTPVGDGDSLELVHFVGGG